MGQGGCALLLIAQMSQNSIEGLPRFIGHDVPVLYATVRRIDDDSDRSTVAAADFDVDADGRPVNSRLSRCYHAPVSTRLLPRACYHAPEPRSWLHGAQ